MCLAVPVAACGDLAECYALRSWCVWCAALHLVMQEQRSAPQCLHLHPYSMMQLMQSRAALRASLTPTCPAAPQISPAGDYREAATAVAILLAILTLVPMAPELADSVGMGVNDAMFY